MKKIYYVMIGVGLFFLLGWSTLILNYKEISLAEVVGVLSFNAAVIGGIYGIYRLFESRKSKTVSK